MTIRALVILVAICFSANAFAKDKLPKVGNKPLVLVKPMSQRAANSSEGSRAPSCGLVIA
jgi:hypothetical protein